MRNIYADADYLTVLPFDAIEQLVSSSAIASFFYQSNILLKLIPGV